MEQMKKIQLLPPLRGKENLEITIVFCFTLFGGKQPENVDSSSWAPSRTAAVCALLFWETAEAEEHMAGEWGVKSCHSSPRIVLWTGSLLRDNLWNKSVAAKLIIPLLSLFSSREQHKCLRTQQQQSCRSLSHPLPRSGLNWNSNQPNKAR